MKVGKKLRLSNAGAMNMTSPCSMSQSRQLAERRLPGRNGWVVVLAGAVLGCGAQQELAPVSGTVTVDGKPVASAQVLFMSPDHRPAAGETDEQGRYELATYTAGDGAAIGTHNVTVTARPTIRVSPAGGTARPGSERPVPIRQGEKPPVPPKYSDPGRPLLTVEVKPGANDIPLELSRD